MFVGVDGIEGLRKLRPTCAPPTASVIAQRPCIEYCLRQSQKKAAGTPVSGVDVGVEIAFYPVKRIALEVAPMVFIDEAGGGNRRARGAASQLGLLVRGQWSVDCYKFVILVFAHISLVILGVCIFGSAHCRLQNTCRPRSQHSLQQSIGRGCTSYPITHCPITGLAPVPHPQ